MDELPPPLLPLLRGTDAGLAERDRGRTRCCLVIAVDNAAVFSKFEASLLPAEERDVDGEKEERRRDPAAGEAEAGVRCCC